MGDSVAATVAAAPAAPSAPVCGCGSGPRRGRRLQRPAGWSFEQTRRPTAVLATAPSPVREPVSPGDQASWPRSPGLESAVAEPSAAFHVKHRCRASMRPGCEIKCTLGRSGSLRAIGSSCAAVRGLYGQSADRHTPCHRQYRRQRPSLHVWPHVNRLAGQLPHKSPASAATARQPTQGVSRETECLPRAQHLRRRDLFGWVLPAPIANRAVLELRAIS